MKDKTLFVGMGAMGGAILRGALAKGVLQAENVLVKEHTENHCKALERELGVTASASFPDLRDIGLIVLAVKPQVLPTILPALKEIPRGTILVSIAAGITLDTLQEAVPSDHWYRVMPNTPVSVNAGMSAITDGTAGGTIPQVVIDIFEAIGETVIVSEADLDRLGALAGAGPGYCFVIMDALADAGVRIGLPRKLAIRAAAQTLYGAGKLAATTGQHPALLRDQVTSPGGTTIAGIAAMEAHGLRTAIHEGVVACYERSNELGRKK